MVQWVLKENGNVVPCRTTRPLNTLEISSKTEKRKRNVFDELVTARWGTPVLSKPPNNEKDLATHPDNVKEDPFD